MLRKQVIEVCEEPVFVIGSPRSGTSVLAWSLAQHPDFWTSPETDFLYWLFGRGRLTEALGRSVDRADGGWLQRLGLARGDLVAALGLGVNGLISSKSGGRRWVDQSPTYTLIAPELAELFPDARFLHILRDGRGVVHSMVNSGFDVGWASDFALACRTWADFATIAARFQREHPERCLTVHYGDLVADPTGVFAEVLEFVHAPLHAGPAAFFASNRINSSFQADGPPAADQPDPWESWSDAQRSTFRREAGETMDALGLQRV